MSNAHAPWANEINELLGATPADPASRFAYLSTLSVNGDPQVRAMVMRDVRAEAGQVMFCTDARTQKAKGIEAYPIVELCWYFQASWLQFRLRGKVELHGPGSGAEDVAGIWASLSADLKKSFFWGTPGTPLAGNVEEPSDLSATPGHFRVAVLTVEEVIRLHLKTSPHNRTRYTTANGKWLGERLW